MIDLFNPLQGVETGVLPVSTHESITAASLLITNITGTDIPNLPPKSIIASISEVGLPVTNVTGTDIPNPPPQK